MWAQTPRFTRIEVKMDWSLASFVLLVMAAVVWLIAKARKMTLEAVAARMQARRTIKTLLMAGETQRLDRLRSSVHESGLGAGKQFDELEKEVRRELQLEE